MRVYAVLTVVGMLGNLLGEVSKRKGDGSTRASSATAAAPEPTGNELCRDKGANFAQVYMANLKQGAEVGATPSWMMSNGCQQIAADHRSVPECRVYCEDGFRAVSKDTVKRLTR